MQFGPTTRNPYFRMRRLEGFLALDPFAADLFEARADDDEPGHALLPAFVGDAQDVLLGHDDDGEIDGVGDGEHRGVALDAADVLVFGIDGKDHPVESVVDDVLEELPPDGSAARRGADDGDRLGLKDPFQLARPPWPPRPVSTTPDPSRTLRARCARRRSSTFVSISSLTLRKRSMLPPSGSPTCHVMNRALRSAGKTYSFGNPDMLTM